jgi:acyl-CoA thioesterase YciA
MIKDLTDDDANPYPDGELALQIVALPADTNQHGLIHGGWLASQMDMAGNLTCARIAKGKVATVAIGNISFLSPIKVGAVIGCYTNVRGVGRSSVRVDVEAWINSDTLEAEWVKVSEGEFIFVAIDDNGRTRAIPRS